MFRPRKVRFGAAARTAGLVAILATSGCATWQAARLYDSGTRALDGGQPSAAIVDLERAASLAPHASEIRNHLGLAYVAAGRPRAAERAFERALALDCDNAPARRNLEALRADAHARSELVEVEPPAPLAVSQRPDAR